MNLLAFIAQMTAANGAVPITLDTSITISIKDLIYLTGVIAAVAKLHRQNLNVMREHTKKVQEMEDKLEVMWEWFTTALERRKVSRGERE